MNLLKTNAKSSKIIVFGAGNITNFLIKDLTLSGHEVLCVTENSFGQVNNLSHTNLEIINYEDVINDKLEVDTAIFSWKDIKRLNQNNQAILGWLQSENFQAKKSFHLSSAAVYKHSNVTQSESCDVIDENIKVVLEKSLRNLFFKKNTNHTNLRISNVYGDGITHGFISSLFQSIKFGTEIRVFQNLDIARDYIYVKDVVYAIKMLLEVNYNQDCLNISTGIGTTLLQLFEIFSNKGFNFEKRQVVPSETNFREISILDCKRLAGLIEWQPKSFNQVLNTLF